jgi:hypothetical protein
MGANAAAEAAEAILGLVTVVTRGGVERVGVARMDSRNR